VIELRNKNWNCLKKQMVFFSILYKKCSVEIPSKTVVSNPVFMVVFTQRNFEGVPYEKR